MHERQVAPAVRTSKQQSYVKADNEGGGKLQSARCVTLPLVTLDISLTSPLLLGNFCCPVDGKST